MTDGVTGITWLAEADCLGQADYATAQALVSALADGQCGLTDGSRPGDWRIPTIFEWDHSVEVAALGGCTDPALTNDDGGECFDVGPTSFTGVVVDGEYISSSTSFIQGAGVFVIDLGSGIAGDLGKTNLYWVWPVRGGHGR